MPKAKAKEPPAEISVPVWFVEGGVMFLRDALEPDHPEHKYNYIKREYKVDPEIYGVQDPRTTGMDTYERHIREKFKRIEATMGTPARPHNSDPGHSAIKHLLGIIDRLRHPFSGIHPGNTDKLKLKGGENED